MLTRLRIRIPDRPGTLGRAAAALGAARVDIHQVRALERDSGRAVLDLVVALPPAMLPGVVPRILTPIPGVRLEGCWQTAESPDRDVELELAGELVAAPGRALATLVDAAPGLLHAHWAVAVAVPGGEPVHASWLAPRMTAPLPRSVRPRGFNASDGTRLALAPVGAGHAILVGRRNAPSFHPAELRRLAAAADVATAVLRGRTPADRSYGSVS